MSRAAPQIAPLGDLYSASKRLTDVVLAATLLLLATPLLLLACVAIVLTTRENPIFRQTRVGRGSRLFDLYKLRTMRGTSQGRRIRLEAAR